MVEPRKPPSLDVDQTSKDSFPASDPPSWTMGSEARSERMREHAGENPQANDEQLHHYQGVQVAILATNGFEQSELLGPKRSLEAVGVCVDVVSLETGRIRSWLQGNWGQEIDVDVDLDHADPDHYDALVLPGGVMNPDSLRHDERAVAFVRAFADGRKPIAAICHGPWLLVEADLVRGRKLTSWPSLQTDIRNAGGKWVDKNVVQDALMITSRMPDDIAEFSRALLTALSGSVGSMAVS